ncbi:hypothetical protein DPSP01_014281 [Paraphaeosphaeria sporulosa]
MTTGQILPAPETPVGSDGVDADFARQLEYRLQKLYEQNLAFCKLADTKSLEYRIGHTPPHIREHLQRREAEWEYAKLVEPATPSIPSTPSTPSTPVTLTYGTACNSQASACNSQSSCHSARTTVTPPSAPELSPVLSGRYNTAEAPSEDKKKRKRVIEEDDGLHSKAKRQCASENAIAFPRRQSKRPLGRASACRTTAHE